jgi:glycosyltransferase involved in cell wall biosynthesis
MKIAIINMTYKGSTGKIMLQIAELARRFNYTVKTYSPMYYNRKNKIEPLLTEHHFNWGSVSESFFHHYAGTLLGLNGLFSLIGTKQLIKQLDSFKPDIIHLHNLHNFTINLPLLFRYIKKENIRVVWTLHDCWAFTGLCPHFTMAKCDKWKEGCGDCPQKSAFSKSVVDTSNVMYKLKKKWFTGLDNMILITPSQWLADLVKQSFLGAYPVKVINNGIDLDVFKPTQSNFRNKYNISGTKKILLGVAFGWGKRKGFDVFLELAQRLDNEKFQIVLVGTDDNVDKLLPDSIISIHRTENQQELAEIYSAADLFVNPTREENYPTVNMESVACGTPVLTFNTGGSPEMLDEKCGCVVACDDIDSLENEIIRICEQMPYKKEDCIERSKKFDSTMNFEKYIELYNSL